MDIYEFKTIYMKVFYEWYTRNLDNRNSWNKEIFLDLSFKNF